MPRHITELEKQFQLGLYYSNAYHCDKWHLYKASLFSNNVSSGKKMNERTGEHRNNRP